jgi:selenocysteine-specific elongation factor
MIEHIEGAYRQAGAQAKNRQEMLDRLGLAASRCDDCFDFLFNQGKLVKLNEESFLHRETYDSALRSLLAHFAEHETLSLAQFRDRIGSARKQTQALLEHFDACKFTLRQGDVRIAWKLPEGVAC